MPVLTAEELQVFASDVFTLQGNLACRLPEFAYAGGQEQTSPKMDGSDGSPAVDARCAVRYYCSILLPQAISNLKLHGQSRYQIQNSFGFEHFHILYTKYSIQHIQCLWPCLESTILKVSQVSQTFLFQKIVDFSIVICQNNKQIY